MRKENVLNGLLVTLVGMSLVLSSRLWFGSPGDTLPLTTQLPTVTPAPSAIILGTALDFTAPESIALVQDGRVLTAAPSTNVYDQLWFAVQPVLGQLGNPSLPYLLPVDEGSLTPLFAKGQVLVVNLPATMPLSNWGPQWQWRETPDVSAAQTQVHRLIFFLNDPARVVFYGSGSVRELFLNGDERATLLETAKDVRATYENRFTDRLYAAKPDEMRAELGVVMPARPDEIRLSLVRAVRTLSPDFAARFFPDMTVVRQIVDSEQSTTYTDGVRLLRLYRYGEIEYVAADEGEARVPTFKRALQVATDFALSHGGFTDYVQLTDVRAVGGHLRLTFGRKAGPVPMLSLTKPLLQMDVVGEKVVRYNRLPDYNVDSRSSALTPVSAEEAVQSVVRNVVGAKLEGIHKITQAEVLTQGPDQVLRSCWVIWLTFRPEPLYVDMVDGKILEQR